MIFDLQLQSATLLDTNATATQQLLQGGAEGGVNGLRRLDRQQQHEHAKVLMETKHKLFRQAISFLFYLCMYLCVFVSFQPVTTNPSVKGLIN